MRNDFTPIETCEIDDAELDNVSGGALLPELPAGLPELPAGLPGLPGLPVNPAGLTNNLPGNIPLGL
jgi:hypothetical protein